MRLLEKIATAGLICAGAIFPSNTSACYYDNYNFSVTKKAQSNAKDLFRNVYEESRVDDVSELRKRLQETELQLKSAPADTVLRNQRANLLARLGKREEANKEFADLYSKNPTDYATLCNYSMLLHGDKKFDQAISLLSEAYKSDPEIRQHAEFYHIEFLKYERDNQDRRKINEKRLPVSALTEVWNKRGQGGEDGNFSSREFPENLTADAMAELIRQFPERGELWHVFAMVLEHEERFGHAVRAYDNAVKFGTPYKSEITDYLFNFRNYAYSQDSARTGGKKLVWTAAVVIALIVLFYVGKLLFAMVSDIREVSENKKLELERERIKREKNGG